MKLREVRFSSVVRLPGGNAMDNVVRSDRYALTYSLDTGMVHVQAGGDMVVVPPANVVYMLTEPPAPAVATDEIEPGGIAGAQPGRRRRGG